MTQVYATAKIYAYIAGAWVELDDVQPWQASWGIDGNGPLDFVAGVGELKFKLNNASGLYTPGGPSALAGFKRGIPVKTVETFEGTNYTKRFYISEIDIPPSAKDKTVSVSCLDWMDYATRHPVVNPGILQDVTSDEVIRAVLAGVEVQPQQRRLTTGVYPFETAMDTVTTTTTAYSEFAKVAFSEITHVYLKKDKDNGETLMVENLNTRHGWVEPRPVPKAIADSGLLLLEDGDFLLLENGDNLVLDESDDVTFDGTILTDFAAPYGDMVINRIVLNAYPRREDASPQILFQLDSPQEIGVRPFEEGARNRGLLNFTLEGTYANPDGGRPVGGRDIVYPVATTDYLFNTAEDGSGSDITSDLVVRFEAGTEGFVAYLANTNDVVGYLTKFNVRGTGIYEYNPIILTPRNDPSIEEFGVQTQTMHLKYRGAHRLSGPFAGGVVVQYAQPRPILEAVYFCANKSPTLMMSYLHTDVGDLRKIDIDELGIDQAYYIQGIETKHDGGLIWVKWIVKEHPTVGYGGLTPVAMEFGGDGTQDAIDWSALVRVSLATERTFAAWVYVDNGTGVRAVLAPFADTGGVLMYVGGNDLFLYSNRRDSGPGVWQTGSGLITSGSWHHIAVTFDHRLTTNDPIMYVDGASQAVTEIETPAGNLNVELGTHVVVGNAKTVTQDYTYPFDGKIFDARIYDRIITGDEAVDLYNGGVPDSSLVTDGLIFQAFAVMTAHEDAYIDTALEDTDRIFENVFRSAGRVNGNPVPRVAP